MKLKLAFATASAMGLLMGAAGAGSNNSTRVVQSGSSNTAQVQQNGSSNVAGSTSYDSYAIKQNGDSNSIDIQQNGKGNRVGVANSLSDSAYSSMGLGSLSYRRPTNGLRSTGVNQIGDHNNFVLRQTETNYAYGDGNAVATVKQESSPTATATTNHLSITQENTSGPSVQFVGDVYQKNDSAGASESEKNSMTVTQTGGGYGAGNRAFILTQNGSSNGLTLSQDGQNNIISRASQTDTGHSATLSQAGGNRNWIDRLDQSGSDQSASVTQTGSDNVVNQIVQSGSDNSTVLNIDGLGNGVTSLDKGAGYVSAPDNGVTQSGTGNEVEMTISAATNNSFGFFQSGSNNEATGITITGDNNQIGVNQIGTNNDFALSTISGNGNNLGLTQQGTGNFSTINISGNLNGSGSFTAGPAATIAALRPSGLIVQGTDGGHGLNDVTLTITSDSNQFSLYQSGTSNKITGSIGGGNANQVAVAQVGSSNVASFSQTGGSNNIGISQ